MKRQETDEYQESATSSRFEESKTAVYTNHTSAALSPFSLLEF